MQETADSDSDSLSDIVQSSPEPCGVDHFSKLPYDVLRVIWTYCRPQELLWRRLLVLALRALYDKSNWLTDRSVPYQQDPQGLFDAAKHRSHLEGSSPSPSCNNPGTRPSMGCRPRHQQQLKHPDLQSSRSSSPLD